MADTHGKYEQVSSEEWWEAAKRGNLVQCCHCCLVHKVDFKDVNGKLMTRFAQLPKNTAAARKSEAYADFIATEYERLFKS